MAHSSELLWKQASAEVAAASQEALTALVNAEQRYQDLLEAYNYAGGSDQLFADLLFSDLIQDEARNPAEATVAEVAKATDLRNAITALHELYGALTNEVTSTADRATDLRRMS